MEIKIFDLKILEPLQFPARVPHFLLSILKYSPLIRPNAHGFWQGAAAVDDDLASSEIASFVASKEGEEFANFEWVCQAFHWYADCDVLDGTFWVIWVRFDGHLFNHWRSCIPQL